MYLYFFAVAIALSVKAVTHLEQGCFYNLDIKKDTFAFKIFLNQQL